MSARDPHRIVKLYARRFGLRCARQPALVEVVRGSTDELGLRHGLLCRDPKSPTGVTATINIRGRIVFLPFGKRHDRRAHAVPKFLAHPAARERAEVARRRSGLSVEEYMRRRKFF